MPSDVTGGNVFNQQRGAFDFLKGPVFTQLLLADEINRAPAKTQSALLEAMQEHSVTVDGTTRPLPDPFFVIATQNPIESQGTYPLPEAQLDRFLFKLEVRAPAPAVEKAILASHLAGFDATALERMGLQRVLTPSRAGRAAGWVRQVRVEESLLEYIAEIVGRTRGHRCALLRRLPARLHRPAHRGAGARRQRGPRLRHPRRREDAGPRGHPAPGGAAAGRGDRGRLHGRLRERDPARGPRAHDRRLIARCRSSPPPACACWPSLPAPWAWPWWCSRRCSRRCWRWTARWRCWPCWTRSWRAAAW
jgi:hypothetical protein